jgi:hypothetical protein
MMMSLPLTIRLAMGVLSHAGDLAKLKEDKNEVRNYVKGTLFEWVIFVWNKTAINEKTRVLPNLEELLNDGGRWNTSQC